MVESYKTITDTAEGLYKEKGSKFLAFAYPVATEAEIMEKLGALRKKYFDARHHCYAYVLNPQKSKYRANDDGEPNHSAGDPILGQIHSNDLTNILVVVVRYFGGIKLGVGGLISAYKTAAAKAIGDATIISRQVMECFTIRYEYKDASDIRRILKELDAIILDQEFEQQCHIKFEIKIGLMKTLKDRIKLLQHLGVNCQTT
jgi:uncharacterized YigZ family protein